MKIKKLVGMFILFGLGAVATNSNAGAGAWEGVNNQWTYDNGETMYVGNLRSGGVGFSMGFDWSKFGSTPGGLEIWPRATFMDQVFIGLNDANQPGFSCDTCKLAVDGEIKAKSITVESTITANDILFRADGWADYVFKDNYDLLPLSKLEDFIGKNGHLPGVPTTSEVNANGVSVSKMTKILLEKVEELTLHMIELKKDNERLSLRISDGLN